MYQVCSPCRGSSELSAAKRREGTIVEQESESRRFGNSRTNNRIPPLVAHVVRDRRPLRPLCPLVQTRSFSLKCFTAPVSEAAAEAQRAALLFKEARLVNACVTGAPSAGLSRRARGQI